MGKMGTVQKMPPVKGLHKPRTEDDMRRALADLVAGTPRLRNDERESIIEDTINEVLALRRLVVEMAQGLDTLHTDIMARRKAILSQE